MRIRLEKGIDFRYSENDETIILYCFRKIDKTTFICKSLFSYKTEGIMPIWELIRKVKQL